MVSAGFDAALLESFVEASVVSMDGDCRSKLVCDYSETNCSSCNSFSISSTEAPEFLDRKKELLAKAAKL